MSETKAPRSRQEPDPASESWRKLPWRKFEQHVYRLAIGASFEPVSMAICKLSTHFRSY
jgi:hypothetical protein